MIRSRQISNELATYVPGSPPITVDSVYQYLYRTTDSMGHAVASASMLIVPYNADPSKLLAYETIYDSSNPDCSPSYTLRYGSPSSDVRVFNMTLPEDVILVSQTSDVSFPS